MTMWMMSKENIALKDDCNIILCDDPYWYAWDIQVVTCYTVTPHRLPRVVQTHSFHKFSTSTERPNLSNLPPVIIMLFETIVMLNIVIVQHSPQSFALHYCTDYHCCCRSGEFTNSCHLSREHYGFIYLIYN